MNDKQVQDLIRGQFMNQMIFRIMDNAKVARSHGQVQKMPLFADIIYCGFVLIVGFCLLGTLFLSLLGFILAIFD